LCIVNNCYKQFDTISIILNCAIDKKNNDNIQYYVFYVGITVHCNWKVIINYSCIKN